MRSQVEHLDLFLTLSFGVLFVFIILIIMRIRHLNKMKRRLSENNRLRGLIIDEYSQIRHEFNNIAQTVVNLIEAEDFNLLSEYKNTMLEKVHMLSRNSIAQLGKIKTDSLLYPIFWLHQNAEIENIVLNITVYKEVTGEYDCDKELSYILKACLKSASIIAGNERLVVNLGISESEEGLYFYFDSEATLVNERMNQSTHPFEGMRIRKRLTYNTSVKDNRYIQELMISLRR